MQLVFKLHHTVAVENPKRDATVGKRTLAESV